MAETAKILAPEKKVLLPDLNAGCSLADSCKAEDFEKFIKENPGQNSNFICKYTAVEIKALSDIICTSSNAVQIVESLPLNEKIIICTRPEPWKLYNE
jgi:quinolinate synthase